MAEYMHLGAIPETTRRLAIESVANNRVRARTFDAINWLYIDSQEPYSDKSPSRLLRDLLIGPWLDVDAALQDLLTNHQQNPTLTDYPRTLLLEDWLEYQIAPILPWLRDLTVLVLSGLDFNQLSPQHKRQFWHPLDRCTFELRRLEIVNCAFTVDQFTWVICLFAKNRIDNLRIHNVHFQSSGPWVPHFAVRNSAREALRVDKFYVGVDSPDPQKTVMVLSALGNLPLSYLCTCQFIFQTRSIVPDVVTSLNEFLSAQGNALKTLTFQVPRNVVVGNPGSPFLGKSLRLYGLDKFLFECPIKNGVWDECLLRLYLNTLTHYGSSGLKTIRISLFSFIVSGKLSR
ncbi:hypothetical protein CPB85DRAFT_774059 [Mucidula mucida]|nr:hypothetical protein CPB85DRAFT_774059 [Mucidula mucida]